MSERDPGQITGYAVALPGRSDSGPAIWFGGGKLAPDLTLHSCSAAGAATKCPLMCLTPATLGWGSPVQVCRTLEASPGHGRTGSG